jgi:putative component of membrane protein insertase Oxa1/YidC/SpoIIIJ protein YidD
MLRKLLVLALLSAPSALFAQGFFQESGKLAFGFYQSVLSPVRQPAGACQFTPSCSQYSKEAIAAHGLIKGLILTADRFMRCSGGHAPAGHYAVEGNKLSDHPSKYPLLTGASKIEVPLRKRQTRTATASNSALVFPKRLFHENEFDYSILELKRLEQDPAAPQEIRSYLPALVAINLLGKNQVKQSWDLLQRVDENVVLTTDHAKDLALIRYIIADQMGYHAWNANTSREFKNPDAGALSLYALARDEEYEEALKLMNASSFGLRKIDIESAIDQLQSRGSKSPVLAGVMSAVLPGTGYMYAGHLQEGLAAMITNGLLGWGIYSLFKNHNTGSGILLSSIAVPFYLGNIIGSANTAITVNQKEQAMLYDGLRNSLQIDFYFSTDFLDGVW